VILKSTSIINHDYFNITNTHFFKKDLDDTHNKLFLTMRPIRKGARFYYPAPIVSR